MIIDFFDNHYVASGHYDDRELFKKAGLQWSRLRRAWVTDDRNKAEKVVGANWTQRALDHVHYEDMLAEASYELSWAATTAFEFPAPPGKAGMPYQQAGVEYAMLRKDTLIADEPGLGKTIQAIGVLNSDDEVYRALFIVPASLKINWYREIDRWMMPNLTFGIAEACRVDKIPDGVYKTGKRAGQVKYRKMETPDYWPNTDIVIINYDILQRFEEKIKSQVWDLLVCDECHTLKSVESMRTLFILGGKKDPSKKEKEAVKERKKEARKAALQERDPVEADRLWTIAEMPDLKTQWFNPIEANRRVFLSGTPMMSRPIELWPLVQAFDPKGLGANYVDYAYRYCAAWHDPFRGKNGALDVSGCSNTEELGQRLRATFMVRRLKAEVLPELPLKRRVVEVLDSPEIRELVAREDELAHALKLYEAMATQGLTLDQAEASQGDQIMNYMAKIGYDTTAEDFDPDKPMWRKLDLDYAAAVAGLEPPAVAIMFEEIALIRRDLGLAKLTAVVPWVINFLQGDGKLILFAYHSDVVKALAEALSEYNPAVIWGGTPVMKRQAQVDKFQEDETCRVFIGNIHAAGVGITLTRAADVAFAEGDWVPAMIEQCEDRACRIGQTADRIMVYFLVANGSLDSRMAQAAKAKEDNIRSTLGRQ